MYAYLKDNSFYLRLENDGLFLKNNFSDISVSTPKSYDLFLAFKRYLDGKNDVDVLIESIENQCAKRFYRELLMVLKEQRFILYDDKEIDISKYTDYEKQLLYYFGNLKEWKQIDDENFFIEIEGPNDYLVEIFTRLLGNRMNIKSQVTDKDYIRIKLHNAKKEIDNIYVYKKKAKRELLVSTNKPVMKQHESLVNLPFHIYEIIGGLLEIEIWLMIHNAPVDSFWDKDYVFDLDMLNGKHIDKEYEDAS